MWIMIDIITEELVRNILLALLVIFVCTFILVMELATSALVLFTVALTIIDTAGFLQFWGLFLDQDFAIFLTISIGLCVDYSAHIAHSFMVCQGSRDQRMAKTLVDIGPAVLNGGISTFCAFALLFYSKSQTFQAFFKVFFLVVNFGLFHGLVFLPVLLSLIGPKSQHLEIADEPGETWAEKSVSNMAFKPESPRGPETISVEQEARMMFNKQRKASAFSAMFSEDIKSEAGDGSFVASKPAEVLSVTGSDDYDQPVEPPRPYSPPMEGPGLSKELSENDNTDDEKSEGSNKRRNSNSSET